jgi:hypothetical protein
MHDTESKVGGGGGPYYWTEHGGSFLTYRPPPSFPPAWHFTDPHET